MKDRTYLFEPFVRLEELSLSHLPLPLQPLAQSLEGLGCNPHVVQILDQKCVLLACVLVAVHGTGRGVRGIRGVRGVS